MNYLWKQRIKRINAKEADIEFEPEAQTHTAPSQQEEVTAVIADAIQQNELKQQDDDNLHNHPVMQLAALLNDITTTVQTEDGFYEDEVETAVIQGMNLVTELEGEGGIEQAAMAECLVYLTTLLKMLRTEDATYEEMYVTYFYAQNHLMRAGDSYDQYVRLVESPDSKFGYDNQIAPNEEDISPQAVLAWRRFNTQAITDEAGKSLQHLHAPYTYQPSAMKVEISQRQLSIALNKVINLSQKTRGGWIYNWAANLQGVNKLMIQALSDAELIKRSGNKFTMSVTMNKLPNWFVYKTLDLDSIYNTED